MRKMHDCDVNTSIEASYFSNGEESTSVAGADEGDACVLNAKAAVEKGGEKKKKKELFFICTCAKLLASSLARVPSSQPTLDSDLPHHLQ